MQINKDVIIGWSVNDPKYDNARLLKVWCNSTTISTDDDNTLTTSDLPGAVEGDDDDDDTLGSHNKTSVKTAKKCKQNIMTGTLPTIYHIQSAY